MKPLYLLLIVCVLLSSSCASVPGYPKVFFNYSPLYDQLCSGNTPVEEKWANEAKKREEEFTQLWDAEAPVLFGKLIAEFGRGFNRKEMTATLSVCAQGWSYSDPLILKINHYLKSYVGEKPLRPNHAFVDLVFHEMLHTWVDENIGEETPLLKKYQAEPPSLRAHLHLMAIQVDIYKKLGRTDMLQWLGEFYPQMPRIYPKAWQIVNDEGYEAFIKEIPAKNDIKLRLKSSL